MNFSHIDTRLTSAQVQVGKEKIEWLLTELALRDNNHHIGTGKGGNNFQLLNLMNLKHTLVLRNIDIHITDTHISWGVPWVINANKTAIRNKLNEVFHQITEKNKAVSIAIKAMLDRGVRCAILEYQDQFPELYKTLSKDTYTHNPNLSSLEKMLAACALCQELSVQLDNGDTSTIQATGAILIDFPTDILLYSIRRHVQIERLVKFNLDEDKVFRKVLDKVTKVVDV